nr:hypothetical protein [Vitiosangium sp. GDMCC 1.1324]
MSRRESGGREPKHGRPNKPMPPVYGTSVGLKGVSGIIRRIAYRYPDHKHGPEGGLRTMANLCQLCQQRPATTQVTRIIGNRRTVEELCDVCASQRSRFGRMGLGTSLFDQFFSGFDEEDFGGLRGTPEAIRQPVERYDITEAFSEDTRRCSPRPSRPRRRRAHPPSTPSISWWPSHGTRTARRCSPA